MTVQFTVEPVCGRQPGVLVVDDDEAYGRLAELLLEEDLPVGMPVRRATTLGAAIAIGRSDAVGCVVLDLSVDDDDDGLRALDLLRDAGLAAPVVVLSGRTDDDIADRALARGAAGYVVKGDEHGGALARAVLAAMAGDATPGCATPHAAACPQSEADAPIARAG